MESKDLISLFKKVIDYIVNVLFKVEDAPKKETLKDISFIPKFGDKVNEVGIIQEALNDFGFNLKVDNDFGNKTRNAISEFQKSKGSLGTGIIGHKTLAWLGLKLSDEIVLPSTPGTPIYPSIHPFHPRFESLLPAPYTHLHPYDVARSVEGEKEIYGKKDNPLIAHLHEHSGNLGTHSEGADYHDEVPHCSSGINWACDMSGCEKSDNALAVSWTWKSSASYNPVESDWIERGDFIIKKTGKQHHITISNKRFNRKTDKYYEGFGFNQANSIKNTTTYKTKEIIGVQRPKPKPGTILAPIGILGDRPVAPSGDFNESTR